MSAQLTVWQKNITYLSIIYQMLEQKKKLDIVLSGDDIFLAPLLDGMCTDGLLAVDRLQAEYIVTKKGRDLRHGMVGMLDQLNKFEIFSKVNQTLGLTVEQGPPDDPNVDESDPKAARSQVYDDQIDPRFVASPESEDLRLAVLDWFAWACADQLQGKTIDLHQVVFMQRLNKGDYNKPGFLYDLRLGTVYAQIDAVVQRAYKWRSAGKDETEAHNVMNAIYTAGMNEQIKRDGDRCNCGAFLGMYDYYAKTKGEVLKMCLCCKNPFDAPTPGAGQACPNCGTDIFPGQRKCRGCKAHIKRSLAAGTIETETIEREEVTETYYPWGGTYASYGYVMPPPVYVGVYYDPFNPLANMMAFGLMCALL